MASPGQDSNLQFPVRFPRECCLVVVICKCIDHSPSPRTEIKSVFYLLLKHILRRYLIPSFFPDKKILINNENFFSYNLYAEWWLLFRRLTETNRCSSDWPFQPYLVFDVGDGSERRDNEYVFLP